MWKVRMHPKSFLALVLVALIALGGAFALRSIDRRQELVVDLPDVHLPRIPSEQNGATLPPPVPEPASPKFDAAPPIIYDMPDAIFPTDPPRPATNR